MRTIAVAIAIAVAIYFIVRPIWRNAANLHAFVDQVHADQLSFWTRVRVLFKGVKTRVWAHLLYFAGPILALLQMTDFIDLTALPPIVLGSGDDAWKIPAAMYVPAVLTPAIAWVTAKLRAATDGPEGQNTFVLEPEKIVPADAVKVTPDSIEPIAPTVRPPLADWGQDSSPLSRKY